MSHVHTYSSYVEDVHGEACRYRAINAVNSPVTDSRFYVELVKIYDMNKVKLNDT